MKNKYNKLPWQRGYRSIPSDILSQFNNLEQDVFYVGISKIFTDKDFASGNYAHLNLPNSEGEVSSYIPDIAMGPSSHRNQHGWEVVRKDLPKIDKTFYWESPNFGDASRFGTHISSYTREVYQREYFEPKFYNICSMMISDNGIEKIYLIYVSCLLDKNSEKVKDELFFCMNLLQENVGAIGLLKANQTKEELISQLNVSWEFFPPGNVDEIIRIFKSKSTDPRKAKNIENRVKLFEKHRPIKFIKGLGGFNTYIGAQYADDLVVFENITYGNALYILYDDWEDVSKRSRIDILKGTDANYDRIIHNSGWEDSFSKLIKNEKRKRRL